MRALPVMRVCSAVFLCVCVFVCMWWSKLNGPIKADITPPVPQRAQLGNTPYTQSSLQHNLKQSMCASWTAACASAHVTVSCSTSCLCLPAHYRVSL